MKTFNLNESTRLSDLLDMADEDAVLLKTLEGTSSWRLSTNSLSEVRERLKLS